MGTLIESISGIRGIYGAGLDEQVLVRYSLAFGTFCLNQPNRLPRRVVVGRDARVSGEACSQIVIATLRSLGIEVIDIGLAPTPTVAMAVLFEEARGGIVLSASHNPEDWNALKLLNEKSEFLSPEEGRIVMDMAQQPEASMHREVQPGGIRAAEYISRHIDAILDLPFCQPDATEAMGYTVVVDGINSVGALALPPLLKRLGVKDVQLINGEVTGRFAHPAEPLPEHLQETMEYVREMNADLGLVVDPDADRLALIDDQGNYVSEELTQVIAADFLWQRRSGPYATNLSSSRAIDDVAARYGMPVFRSAVGEINVVKTMQQYGAILGGEGNGGVILPDLHYGRDALVGTAIILQHLAEQKVPLSEYRRSLPRYVISKNKITVSDPDEALRRFASRHAHEDISTVDGVKINLPSGWVHVRKSNTEPIVRIYAEASSEREASDLARWCMDDIGLDKKS
ncbi:MAG: phosphoglucosamine mutase [Rhodothermaceae bacterium]|nr:phosphoglucosamine mutase [Bacteroidota bacterium]MXW13503.1 phosphoglucosamine mutase [Rhodothermaceae bacterium]MYC04302.1 phosphoglucosamine mutase [Rhodothermaceae bacterium]MYI16654.1 phosphoglucosamine mutase [Rhodothermaceae bacterium]